VVLVFFNKLLGKRKELEILFSRLAPDSTKTVVSFYRRRAYHENIF
jgi:hypothetical protein